MHYPGLIKNRCGVYCYRLTFPARLRQLGAPRELRLSLHTKRRDNLKARWLSAFHAATSLISEIENLLLRDITDMAEVGEKLKEHIATWRTSGPVLVPLDELRRSVAQRAEEVAFARTVRAEWENKEQTLLSTQKELAETIATVHTKSAELEAVLVTTKLLAATSSSVAPVTSIPVLSVRDEPLTTLRDRFNEHCATVEKLAAKTLKQRQSNLERFLDVVGPRSSAALCAADIRHYRDVIRALPANLTKKPIWQERPDALTLRPDWYRGLCKLGLPSLSEQGQLTHFHDTGPFLKWLSAERYLAEDFSDMLTPIKNNVDYQERGQPFTQEQLNTLVVALWQADSRRPREQPKDWHFWAPLLGLTMAMRGDEIGRLCVADVVVVGNVSHAERPRHQDRQRRALDPAA